MPEKLKPCPFCGGKVKIDSGFNIDFNNRAHKFYYAICLSCGARGSDADRKTEAIELWNRRIKFAKQ